MYAATVFTPRPRPRDCGRHAWPIEGLIGATKESLGSVGGPSEPAIPMLMVMFSVPARGYGKRGRFYALAQPLGHRPGSG